MTEFEIRAIELLEEIRDAIKSQGTQTRTEPTRRAPLKPQYELLLDALADVLKEDLSLPVNVGEILQLAEMDYDLGRALDLCRANTTARLGAVLRAIHNGAPHPRLRLINDGHNAWLLERL